MRIYVDSSALVKRVLREPESAAVVATLERYVGDGGALYSSSLAWIEVGRAIRTRADEEAPAILADYVDVALSGIAEYPVTEAVVSLARRIGSSRLRSLDAIHLSTATLIDADVVLAYDERLLSVARELGFATDSPT